MFKKLKSLALISEWARAGVFKACATTQGPAQTLSIAGMDSSYDFKVSSSHHLQILSTSTMSTTLECLYNINTAKGKWGGAGTGNEMIQQGPVVQSQISSNTGLILNKTYK